MWQHLVQRGVWRKRRLLPRGAWSRRLALQDRAADTAASTTVVARVSRAARQVLPGYPDGDTASWLQHPIFMSCLGKRPESSNNHRGETGFSFRHFATWCKALS